MIRIKSLRPCTLIIPDAGLKLSPGQVVSVSSLSPQIEKLLTMGYVARLEEQVTDTGASANHTAEEVVTKDKMTIATAPKEYENLSVQKAIKYINEQTDPQVLRAILKEEKRDNLLEAINKRLGELEK